MASIRQPQCNFQRFFSGRRDLLLASLGMPPRLACMSRFDLIRELTFKRIVIKVGSSLLADSGDASAFHEGTFAMLAEEIAHLRRANIETLLVSSGAVNTGRMRLREFHKNPAGIRNNLVQRQALSAIGQSPLISHYARHFEKFQIPIAQILITARDFRERRSYLNIGHTTNALLEMGVLPIINENDTVSTDELQFGENDFLSAACAALFGADLLIILTSVEGFFLEGRRLSEIKEITEELRQAAGGPEGPGSGGMQSKLRAGELCQLSGHALAILPGRHPSPIRALLDGEDIGTMIHLRGSEVRISARKKWLLFSRPKGSLVVDAGAADAIRNKGASLLPAGIRKVSGEFYEREVVDILLENGEVLGRGITNYSARELHSILANPTKKDGEKYGPLRHSTEAVHRDNLVLEKSL